MTTDRIHIVALAALQTLGFFCHAASGARWAAGFVAASFVVLASAAWSLRGRGTSSDRARAASYRATAQREEEATILDAARAARSMIGHARLPRKRVLREEYEQAASASFGLCAGAGTCGACGLFLATIAWQIRDRGPLILCGGFTIAGFVLLAWWARCRSTVRAWRDQERERGRTMKRETLTADECARRSGMSKDEWLDTLRKLIVTSFDDGAALDLRELTESEVTTIGRGLREIDSAVENMRREKGQR